MKQTSQPSQLTRAAGSDRASAAVAPSKPERTLSEAELDQVSGGGGKKGGTPEFDRRSPSAGALRREPVRP